MSIPIERIGGQTYMTEEKLFTIKTRMGEQDYNKFLYIATFLRSRIVIPILLFISALGAFLLSFSEGKLNITKFTISWLVYIAAIVLVIIRMIKRMNKKRRNTDNAFSLIETLDFHKDFVKISSTSFEGEASINYDNFYQVLESKDYFINYFDKNQTSLIRKEDMDEETIEKLRSLYQDVLGRNYKRIRT